MSLDPGVLVAAATVEVPLEPVPTVQVIAGEPSAGFVVLDERDGREIGVWEMTPGTATDTEVDEVFVVLAGSATVSFESPEVPAIELAPGAVVRLTAGMRTTWVVRETLRKVYVA
ncbi:MAG: cupin domain-containing protein [Pseudolysinimonas sp.]|uniref:cupin domain-containing protein n=1 Tax=Pseudolysinimonas sp. TaxID=2680009 RepID=UPI003C7867E5